MPDTPVHVRPVARSPGEAAPPARTGHARFVLKGWMLPAAVLALYAWPFPHFEILRSPNELSRLYQVRAIVDDHSLSVNGPVARHGPMGDLSESGGKLYPNKAPGVSFLGVPVYAALRAALGGPEHVSNRTLLYFLRLLCAALPTVLLLRPLRRHAARLSGDPHAANAAVLAFAFGTLAFPYSILYFSHQPAAVCAAGAFLCLERARGRSDGSRPLEIAAGALAGFAVLCEYTVAPLALVVAVYGFATSRTKERTAVRLFLGAAPFAAALLAYQTVAFGGPFVTSYQRVQNSVFASWHAQGYMGVAAPRLSSLLGNLFSPARGLYAYAPVLLLALPGLWLALRRDLADGLVATLATAFYFFLAAAFLYEAWGWMLGPRHLAPLVPLLVAPLACALAWMRAHASGWSGIAVGAGAGLAASSIAVNGLSTAVYPHIPDWFTAALAHLVWPLARSGHFPYNLAEALTGRAIPWTWIPWFVALGIVAVLAARYAIEGERGPWPIAAALAAFALHVGVLFAVAPAPTRQEIETRDWIMRTWEPAPGRATPLFGAPERPP